MKIEGFIFALAAAFYLVVGGIYWFLTYDTTGTTVIVLTGVLGVIIAFYILYTAKRVYPRPEDRLDAEIDEADPEYGFFSPHSWWPFAVGLGAFLTAMGFVFAVWLVVVGVSALMFAVIGWLFEYYRGNFAT